MSEAIRKELQSGMLDWVQQNLENLDPFTGLNEVHWYGRETTALYRHPSILVAVDVAEIVQEETQIHKCEVEVYCTSPSVDSAPDGTDINAAGVHQKRLLALEDLIYDVQSAYDHFLASGRPVRFMEPHWILEDFEGATTDRHWVDKYCMTVFCQYLGDGALVATPESIYLGG